MTQPDVTPGSVHPICRTDRGPFNWTDAKGHNHRCKRPAGHPADGATSEHWHTCTCGLRWTDQQRLLIANNQDAIEVLALAMHNTDPLHGCGTWRDCGQRNMWLTWAQHTVQAMPDSARVISEWPAARARAEAANRALRNTEDD